MTRIEQIRNAARYKYQDERIHFIDGAKWADSHPQWIPVEEELPKEKGKYMFRLSEVKAMVKTIHDLREKVNQLGWHPASEKPIIPKDKEDIWVYCLVYGEDKDEKVLAPMFLRYTKLLTLGWVLPDDMIVVWWCYPPKEE